MSFGCNEQRSEKNLQQLDEKHQTKQKTERTEKFVRMKFIDEEKLKIEKTTEEEN